MQPVGVTGCMILLVGGLGMRDTMMEYLRVLDEDISSCAARINLSDTASNNDAVSLS